MTASRAIPKFLTALFFSASVAYSAVATVPDGTSTFRSGLLPSGETCSAHGAAPSWLLDEISSLLQISATSMKTQRVGELVSDTVPFTGQTLWETAGSCLTQSVTDDDDDDIDKVLDRQPPLRPRSGRGSGNAEDMADDRELTTMCAAQLLTPKTTETDAGVLLNKAIFCKNTQQPMDVQRFAKLSASIKDTINNGAGTGMETSSKNAGTLLTSSDNQLLGKMDMKTSECENYVRFYQNSGLDVSTSALNMPLFLMVSPEKPGIPTEELCQSTPIAAVFANMQAAVPNLKFDMKFDLKGSTDGREAKKDELKKQPGKTLDLKDKDFLDRFPEGLTIEDTRYPKLSEEIYNAAMWLGQNGFQDYSLMLYVKKMKDEIAVDNILKQGQSVDAFPMKIAMFDKKTSTWYAGVVGGILDNLELFKDKDKLGIVSSQGSVPVIGTWQKRTSLVPPLQYACRFALYLTRFVLGPKYDRKDFRSAVPDSLEHIQDHCYDDYGEDWKSEKTRDLFESRMKTWKQLSSSVGR